MKQLFTLGILMMTFDSDSPDSNRVEYIGTNNKTAGRIQGETLRWLARVM